MEASVDPRLFAGEKREKKQTNKQTTTTTGGNSSKYVYRQYRVTFKIQGFVWEKKKHSFCRLPM